MVCTWVTARATNNTARTFILCIRMLRNKQKCLLFSSTATNPTIAKIILNQDSISYYDSVS